MKKTISMMLVLVLVCAAFASCSGDLSDVVA